MTELTGKFTSAKIFADTIEEGVISQIYNIINNKAFENQTVICMPDIHVGASGPCGLVATIGDYICPEHIGVDIGCSVSMIILDKQIPKEKYAEFEHRIKNKIPFGMNIHPKTIIDYKEFYRFLTNGFNKYRNYWPEALSDLPNHVDENWVTDQLKRIGMDEGMFYKSLGTVGGGNHFIEYDEQENGDLAGITLHFGSRNFGLKVCHYWMKQTKQAATKKEIKKYTKLFKEAYIKNHSDMTGFEEALRIYLHSMFDDHIEGYLHNDSLRGYLKDMCFAQLYAQYNHLTVQNIIKELLIKYGIKEVRTIMSTHNFIDLKDHVLRKSAIRSYEDEEILIPFNMRDGIAICEGKSNSEWLNSCAHGAGRIMSRTKAKENISLDDFKESMKDVYSTTVCQGTIDESPMAYKDTDEIKKLISETCEIKFMMVPKINIKAVE